MTKEVYDKYDGLLYCKTCKSFFPKIHIDHKKVYPDGSVTRCGVCEWIKRNSNKLNIDGYTDEEIKCFLHFLFYADTHYLNDIAEQLNRTLEDILDLYIKLKVYNKKAVVRAVCENCGCEFECTPSRYMKSKYLYCSHDCYYSDKKNKSKKGADSIFYNRINC